MGVTAATVNGVVYVIGGNLAGNGGGDGGPTPTAKVESYHPNTTTLLAWRNRAPMPGVRSFTNGAAVIDGKIYVSGGYTLNAEGQYVRTRTLYRYDPVNDVWASRARLPRATSGGATVAIDGKLYAYVVYGADNSSGAALYRYDPAADVWTELAMPPAIQVGAAATVLGGKMWVIGGRFGKGAALATVSVFDPGTGKWTTKPPLEMAREGLVARTIDGRIYVAGGSAGGSGAVEYLEMYDPAVGGWFVTKAVIPTPRAYAASAVVGGNLYVIGGTAGDGRTNEMYVP
jgi:N-acetylneuraminic acid mutarotase